MLTLERFIKGIMDSHNLFVGIPIMILSIMTIMCLPFAFDYALKSMNNALYIIRILVIWYNVMYLLVLYYNSTLPAMRNRNRPARNYITPERRICSNIARIFRTMTIDIRLPPPGDGLVVNDVDAENVHDSGVQNGVAEAIQRLKTATPLTISEDETMRAVKKYIFEEYKGSLENKELAYCALREIDRDNAPISRLGMKERSVLQLVWNRFHQHLNRDNIENLRSNLILELAASMKNIDAARCPTGRVNRIVQSLELADAEDIVSLKTESMMEQEINYLIGPLREQYLGTVTEEERAEYESDEEAPEIIAGMRTWITSQLRQKYVDCSLLTEEKFNTILSPLLIGLE